MNRRCYVVRFGILKLDQITHNQHTNQTAAHYYNTLMKKATTRKEAATVTHLPHIVEDSDGANTSFGSRNAKVDV